MGNEDVKFDLCFGGRRQFCDEDYADLGKALILLVQPLLHVTLTSQKKGSCIPKTGGVRRFSCMSSDCVSTSFCAKHFDVNIVDRSQTETFLDCKLRYFSVKFIK